MDESDAINSICLHTRQIWGGCDWWTSRGLGERISVRRARPHGCCGQCVDVSGVTWPRAWCARPETQMVSRQGSSSVTARRLSVLTSGGAKIKRTWILHTQNKDNKKNLTKKPKQIQRQQNSFFMLARNLSSFWKLGLDQKRCIQKYRSIQVAMKVWMKTSTKDDAK